MNILIPKEINLDDQDFAFYILVAWLTKMPEQYLTIEYMEYYLHQENNLIKSSVDRLIINGYIKGKILAADKYLITHSFASDYFTYFDSDVYVKLMNLSYKGKYGLIKYLYILLGSINNKTKISTMPIEYLAEKTRKTVRTIHRYNKILEEIGIISIKKTYRKNNCYVLLT